MEATVADHAGLEFSQPRQISQDSSTRLHASDRNVHRGTSVTRWRATPVCVRGAARPWDLTRKFINGVGRIRLRRRRVEPDQRQIIACDTAVDDHELRTVLFAVLTQFCVLDCDSHMSKSSWEDFLKPPIPLNQAGGVLGDILPIHDLGSLGIPFERLLMARG
jgi:hypothetical protein